MATNTGTDFPPMQSGVVPTQLPIRGEKRIITAPLVLNVFAERSASGVNASTQSLDPDSGNVVAAKRPYFSDYVRIRLPHRGLDSHGNPDFSTPAEFRFVINPTTLQVSRDTVDVQSLSRSGWQFSVWGDGLVNISISGTTAGQYFALGLTDEFHYYTKSFRNLEQLTLFFENNGYFFEGEGMALGALAPDFTRRRIKCHQDVELYVGNFIWSGMFDSFSYMLDAENPFLAKFNLSFTAWKERFDANSPYLNSRECDIERGHVYKAYSSVQGKQENQKLLTKLEETGTLKQQEELAQEMVNRYPNINSSAAAILAEVQAEGKLASNTVMSDQNANMPMLSPTSPSSPALFPSSTSRTSQLARMFTTPTPNSTGIIP